MLDARALLRKHGLYAKKSFGQNFLVSPHVIETIARACAPDGARSRIVELGAGLGALTSALLERAERVVAVERDRDLVPILGEALQEAVAANKLAIVEGDAQGADVEALLGPRSAESFDVLCGNLPYQITGRLLQLAVHQADRLDRAVFMVQEEVADRLVAPPGSKEYGALTVFVRAAFQVSMVTRVSRGSFHPSPDVTSAVVMLTPLRPRPTDETPCFRAAVRRAFAARRKTLRNAWRGLLPDEELAALAAECGVSLDARGETLDVDAFARVARALEARGAVGVD